MDIYRKEVEIGDKKLILETGLLAIQANAAVMARMGDTIVLATVVSAPLREDLGYFPLYVDYMERLYAGGRIKGSRWVKREGRPSDEAILISRLIDRAIRPLFPKNYQNEVQVLVTVLSVDAENNPDVLALCATSAALAISNIPWDGPVGGVRIGSVPKNGEKNFFVNPTHKDLEYSEMNLVAAGSKESILMMEGEGRSIPEESLVEALAFGWKEIKKICEAIEKMQSEVGTKKRVCQECEIDKKLIGEVTKKHGSKIAESVKNASMSENVSPSLSDLRKAICEEYSETEEKEVGKVFDEVVKNTIRDKVLKEGVRIDDRKPDEIRPIKIQVGILPRTHGSALFQRGKTQALTIATLGAPSLEQLIEGMEGEETKRYIHHYYMPPFASGETGKTGWPSRREVGHGALAEKALEPAIPSEEEFPYTIRVVSEIMSSNGSTSMASVCGSTLSLMDAGVPIKEPVAGIAMGLVSDGKKHVILSDILGFEDFCGDMDFKIAGTKDGITAIQLDVKNTKIPLEIYEKLFDKAREGRLFILDKMLSVLPTARKTVSKFAPKVRVVHVPVEKIGEVIGPGGKRIRSIISETGASVDIDDKGCVNISALDEAAVNLAEKIISNMVREFNVGEEFEGEVKRVQPFGAFVEITPGREGLVHVSRMADHFVKDPASEVQVGQKVKVRVIEIDDQGRINLTMNLNETADSSRSSRPFRRSEGFRPGFKFGRPGGRSDSGLGGRSERRDFGKRPPRRRDFGGF